ncbi:MAG: bifunctional riboflavin kinase/FAD synthetase [Nitrosomonas sp.]|nr:MAG: bifunctional riboflavin kinase/FAD synthetase [Nitrosomonas sp.]
MHTWRKASIPANTPIALTIGNFDGVHLGHQAMLARLKKTASELRLPACVMTFEPHPQEFFAPDQAPARLTGLREKLHYIVQTGIDAIHVCRFNFDFARTTPEQFINNILHRQLSVRWLLVGDDFRFGARRAGDFALLQACSTAHGYTVEAMPSVTINGERISSTSVRRALTGGDLEAAQKFLGRPYCISGRVSGGDQLGRKIGYPTANIRLKHRHPALTGIFVVSVRGAMPDSPATSLPGVASLGVRPTTHENGVPVLEVYLFDFDRNIYGQHLQVDFLHKLRDEVKFPDLNALIRQIDQDVAQAKAFFQTAMPQSNRICGTV